ncbi:hypothetical protein AAE02nite_29190 [Adhaeribacter aerolatus]|uniref:DUF983 domain-containing protein n=1 Tax=Adhaeribacter aerolatus TaxID=670289 RepID=A0A512AZW0_9BACT|nr:DUF983 domain-containing protein [Adhaeribacter aerolatus]GEO05255.1 hypothetical protein AAE02nite_29190 [Adhaeribacter aerolatus]
MSHRSTLKAILKCKCPRCHRGDMFTHSAINLRKFDNMYEHCPVCKFRYEIELGFYWGAMYISYGFSVINVLIVGVSLFYLANDPPLWVYTTAITLVTVLLTTFLFRYARVVMLYLFGSVHYDPVYDKS